MAQQTVVDYLIEKIKLKYDLDLYHVKEEIGKANNMFQEQIINAHFKGSSNFYDTMNCKDAENDAHNYYNETYNK